MADDVKITNLPDGGTPERVAHDLFRYLRNLQGEQLDQALDQYAKCLKAAKGLDHRR